MRNNPLCLSYDRDVPTHPNEEFDRRRFHDEHVVTPLPFSMFEFLERYPTSYDAGRLRRLWTDGAEFQVPDHLGKRQDAAIAGWAKRWTNYGGRSALSWHCRGKDTESPFVCCREELDYEGRMVGFLAWMGFQEDFVTDELNLKYFVVSPQFERLSFLDRQEHLARAYNFEMHMRTNRLVAKRFVEWHNVEAFELPARGS